MTARHAPAVQNYGNFVSFFYIGRTRHDLDRLSAADGHLTYDQFVCIRMALNLLDLPDDNMLKILVHSGESLHLGS